MTEPSSQDKWGELARTLGAEVREEPPEPVRETGITSKPRAAARTPVEPPHRPPAGWDELIDEFGLPAVPAELPKKATAAPVGPPVVRPPRPKTEASPPKPKRIEQKPQVEQARQRPEDGQRSRGEKRSRSDQAPSRERREPERKERRPSRGERQTRSKERSDRPAERSDRDEPTAERTPARAERPPAREEQPQPANVAPKVEPPQPAPPRSAYGLPDWFPFARKRSDASAPPVEPEPQLTPFQNEEEVEIQSEQIAEVELTTSSEEEPESDDGDVRKGKRRRPRRRRRGGKSKEESTESRRTPRSKSPSPAESIVVDLGPAEHEVELFSDDEEEDDEDEPLSSHEDEEDDSDEGSSTGARPASHRSIPSWAEAIGVVVEANLATRTERKKTVRPPGAGRGGRSRGRRKKRS